LSPSRIRQVQPLEERIEIGVGGGHDRPPPRCGDAAVLSRVQALRCAPALRAPPAAWTRPPRGSRPAGIVEPPVLRLVERQRWHRGADVVGDVLRADRLLGHAALERGAQRGVAMGL
jgi:hypothetical protein